MTTNYDGLIEKYCGLEAVDSGNDAGVYRWRRGSTNKYVFHPHGTWKNPAKVVLSTRDYYSVVNDKVVQDTLRATLTDKTILFIGSGAGLGDPNLGKLLEVCTKTCCVSIYMILKYQRRNANGTYFHTRSGSGRNIRTSVPDITYYSQRDWKFQYPNYR